VDYYAWTQTNRLPVGSDYIENAHEDWETIPSRLRRLWTTLAQGKTYKIRMELVFRIQSSLENAGLLHYDAWKIANSFPIVDTPWSYPIAEGEFDMKIPSSPTPCCVLSRIFRKRATTLGGTAAVDLEGHIFKWLSQSPAWGQREYQTEVPLFVVLSGDWHVVRWEWFNNTVNAYNVQLVKEAVQCGIGCIAYFYRSKRNGWLTDEITAIELVALGQETRRPVAGLPLTGVGVGTSWSFDVDLLPDDVRKEVIGK